MSFSMVSVPLFILITELTLEVLGTVPPPGGAPACGLRSTRPRSLVCYHRHRCYRSRRHQSCHHYHVTSQQVLHTKSMENNDYHTTWYFLQSAVPPGIGIVQESSKGRQRNGMAKGSRNPARRGPLPLLLSTKTADDSITEEVVCIKATAVPYMYTKQ